MDTKLARGIDGGPLDDAEARLGFEHVSSGVPITG